MMTGPHPSDLELFEYVEGELAESDASAIREHLESCAVCAAAVAASVTGRDALARSPQLELPDAAWQRALGSLGSQEREPGRRWTARRILAVLAPVAAVTAAVVAVVVVVTGDDGGNGSQADAGAVTATLEAAAGDAAGGGAESGAEDSSTAALEAQPAPVREVAGPADDVVALLEEAGFEARAVEGQVEVTGATADEVTRALADRVDGPVPVYVLP